MSRVQLALRLADLQASVGFDAKLFGTAPAKLRPGYANFALTEPCRRTGQRAEVGTSQRAELRVPHGEICGLVAWAF